MPVVIAHSKVYGTTDWFEGDVQVYDIGQAEPAIECLLEPRIRNWHHDNFVINNEGVFCGLPNVGNMNVKLVYELIDGGMSTGIRRCQILSGDYIFFMEATAANRHLLHRYDLVSDVLDTINPEGLISGYSVISDNEICYAHSDDSPPSVVYHNYNSGSTTLFTADANESGTGSFIIVPHGSNLYLYMPVSIYDGASYTDVKFYIYNLSTDTLETVTMPFVTPRGTSTYGAGTHGACAVTGKKVTSTFLHWYEDSVSGDFWFTVFVTTVDIIDLTYTQLLITTDVARVFTDCFHKATDSASGKVYLCIDEYPTDVESEVYEYDPETGLITSTILQTFAYDVQKFLTDNDYVYYTLWDLSITRAHDDAVIGNTPLLAFTSNLVDDADGRVWVFSDNLLTGYRAGLANKEISILLPRVHNRGSVFVQGNRVVIFQRTIGWPRQETIHVVY